MLNKENKLRALGEVMETLDILRVKCPWDAKQTNESLRPNTIEETYELVQALMDDDNANICKELGDVLLHILFYAKIGEEKGAFDMADVADKLNQKLIFRHPHVFGDVTANDAQQVSQNWEKNQTQRERRQQRRPHRRARCLACPDQSLSNSRKGVECGLRLGEA